MLNIIINKKNKKIIDASDQIMEKNPTTPVETDQSTTGLLGKAITTLTKQQWDLVLQDVRKNAPPPLRKPILTHTPGPYLSIHPESNTSLELVDAKCKALAVFCRQGLAKGRRKDGIYIEKLLQSFMFNIKKTITVRRIMKKMKNYK